MHAQYAAPTLCTNSRGGCCCCCLERCGIEPPVLRRSARAGPCGLAARPSAVELIGLLLLPAAPITNKGSPACKELIKAVALGDLLLGRSAEGCASEVDSALAL